MIKPNERFMSEGQGYFGSREDPNTETHCNVWDWDQLCMIKLKGTAKLFPPNEDVEVPILARMADLLSPEIRAVTVNDEGLIVETSRDPEEDDTMFIGYLPLSSYKFLHGCRQIQYSKLKELDRLGPGVDLCSYHDESGTLEKVVFKFNPIGKDLRLNMAWNEINLLATLSTHPNIVPFDRVVLDDVESRVVGFTVKYIPGGTLENPKIPFRFEWLKQLTELVDYLNLDWGVMHQDIAPRNLLIDPETQKLLLFDFNWAVCDTEDLSSGRDDVTGVIFTLYELITNDTHFTSIAHWERNVDVVQHMTDWPCKRELDADVTTLRKFLDEWVATRRSPGDLERFLNAPNQLELSKRPNPPDYNVPFPCGTTLEGETAWSTGPRGVQDAIGIGQFVFRWQRPPQSRLKGPDI
ncbi:hypothetical protein EJ05DRAFT_256170 [Pseudovirgaria hyperparasitica]|uniref:EKC/KEOPS complex subunit BUD32 n=1 Tax=Pseudovirgaria hyperparasitica TaxID=470096 RepID=A0A6A6WGM1_9PEZI|nr:uncharacterized protein EJ05DRAFT_256170 [Pseudovirgaria hyperparasitica]KAF2761200.1 hypothetical protein EJ05DRAFT_256170 [Pseudovirgaria hyperparasitica]